MSFTYIPNDGDIFLSPHSDDICFSLGHLVSLGQKGRLITIFSESTYCSPLYRGEHSLRFDASRLSQVTSLRRNEDLLFAKRCHLSISQLGIPDSMARNDDSFDQRLVPRLVDMIEGKLIGVIKESIANNATQSTQQKPHLFCPIGIGGHVDHIAVLMTVLRLKNQLDDFFKIVFYEDLFYASQQEMRQIGLDRLFNLFTDQDLKRFSIGLDEDDCRRKMDLISLYRSQLTEEMSNIQLFRPASNGREIHEAVWY